MQCSTNIMLNLRILINFIDAWHRTPEERTMHNTDVQRIIEYFCVHEQEQKQLQPMSGKSSVGK
uniref:Uncharacterized protein n=1 Tax=Rhizophora mucronata TaxID=61149 RepID=A0A2P2JIR3_RHIMU